MDIFGTQLMGKDPYQNLMAWEEFFSPKQSKEVRVIYELTIQDLQQGDYKRLWFYALSFE